VADRSFVQRKESPFSFFALRALGFADSLHVEIGLISEALGIIGTAFGVEWLNREAESFPRSAAIPFRRHPLGDMISTAGEQQVADALELSAHLTAVKNSQGLPAVIAGLKGYYHSALLQLATGARLARAGASDIEFEPPASANRASDIRCTVSKHSLRVECYRTTSSIPPVDAHIRLAQLLLDTARTFPHVVHVAVNLVGLPTSDMRRQIERLVADGLRDVLNEASADREYRACLLIESHFGVISICKAQPTKAGSFPELRRHSGFPRQDDEWTICLRTSLSPKEYLVHSAPHLDPGEGRSMVGIWLPENDASTSMLVADDANVQKLGRKIEAKLVQARSSSRDSRVLVVQTPLTTSIADGALQQGERLRRKIVEAHDGVQALMLVERRRRLQTGYLVVPLIRHQAPAAILPVLGRFAKTD